MDDLSAQVEALRRRLRLQNLLSVGVLVILMFAMGGADTVARTFVEADSWKVRTRKADLSYVDRLIATTDVDRSKLKVLNGNIQLEGQTSLPALAAADEGTLGFDSTAKKLMYWNGTTWVDSSGGGGGGGVSAEAWRLEYSSINSIVLAGLGSGGGTININGTLRSFTTGPTLAPTGLTAGLVYRLYAYWNGSTIALEASTTTSTSEEYGRYSEKQDAPSRRFVGLCRPGGTGPTFSEDMVRSTMNERGYAHMKRHAPASPANPSITGTTWQDLDSNVQKDGLFFNNDRIRVWSSAQMWVPGWNNTGRCRLGISVAGSPLDDTEATAELCRGAYWADSSTGLRAEGYVTVAGAGVKNIRAIHRAGAGGYSQWYISSNNPASVGFEVVR